MPLKPGANPKTISSNISELHTGNTYQKTFSKYGKETANKQAIAIVYNKAGISKRRPGRLFNTSKE